MHVLMLCALDVWALPTGGGAPTLHRTLRAYGERGHRVTVVAPTLGANAYTPTGQLADAPASEPPEIPNVTFERFHLPSLQESRLPLAGPLAKLDQKLRFATLFPALAARRAEEVLRREAVDVLYAYEVHGALGARLLQRKHLLPTVARFQGTVLHPTLGQPLARLRKYEEVLALRLPADLYIMTDDGTRGDEVLARLNPAAVSKLRFWRNGLDLERLRPAEPAERVAKRRALDLPDDAIVLLTASRLAAWKRVDRAISAMAHIIGSLPNVVLLVVGDGEERERLERQARRLGVAASVRFAGAVPQADVVDYMHATDIFLALADLSNVGNPLLEAMCCGLPIVTVDAGATDDLVRDGETGRLLGSGSPLSVADAVRVMAKEPSERQRLGEAARREAEGRFWTWEARLEAELEEVERVARGPVDAAPVAGVAHGRA